MAGVLGQFHSSIPCRGTHIHSLPLSIALCFWLYCAIWCGWILDPWGHYRGTELAWLLGQAHEQGCCFHRLQTGWYQWASTIQFQQTANLTALIVVLHRWSAPLMNLDMLQHLLAQDNWDTAWLILWYRITCAVWVQQALFTKGRFWAPQHQLNNDQTCLYLSAYHKHL